LNFLDIFARKFKKNSVLVLDFFLKKKWNQTKKIHYKLKANNWLNGIYLIFEVVKSNYIHRFSFLLFGLVSFNFFKKKSTRLNFLVQTAITIGIASLFFFSLESHYGYFWGGCSIFLEKGMFKLGFKFWLWCHWLMCAGPGGERERKRLRGETDRPGALLFSSSS
jgi:hypothetical protein